MPTPQGLQQSGVSAASTSFRTLFMNALHGDEDVIWPRFAMKTASSNAEELYMWLGSFPGMKEFMGEMQIRKLAEQGYRLANKKFYDAFEVPLDALRRNAYGIYSARFTAMGLAAATHYDEMIAGALKAGFTGDKCYTGQPFFSTNHKPQGYKAAWSNKSTKVLSANNFTAARTAIRSRLKPDGNPMGVGRKLALVVGPEQETLGQQILEMENILQIAKNAAGTENIGAAAVSNPTKDKAELIVMDQLADTPGVWFLLDIKYPIRPLILQEETPVKFTAIDQITDSMVMTTQMAKYFALGNSAAGYGLPELAFGSTGVDA
jgi:phage major head subunit gpT-like protein